MSDGAFDPLLDCYLSWEAYIRHCRDRLEATGEYPPTGPWGKREAEGKERDDRGSEA
jgi:hypothetical protein